MDNKNFSQILDLHGISNIEEYFEMWLNDFKESNHQEAAVIIGTGSGYLRKKVISILEKTEDLTFYFDLKSLTLIIKKLSNDNENFITQNVHMTNSMKVMYNSLFLLNNANKLNAIQVNKVFGLYDYKINFTNECVFVLHAPNGCGKTNLLNIINNTFNAKEKLERMPFESIEIYMNEQKYSYYLNKNNKIEGNCPELECIFMNDLLNYNLNEIKDKFLRKSTMLSYKQYNINLKTKLFEKIMSDFFCFEKEVKLSKNWQYETEIDDIFDIIYKEENKFNVCNVYECGQKIPFIELSTGERNIIKIIFRLIFEPKYGSFIMLDEPEISLHMEWQLLLLKNIIFIAKEYELKILIATHSPYVVESDNIEVGSVEYADET